MHIILGGTGQVGSAVARTLEARGESVTIITRDKSKAGGETATRRIAEVDIRDVERLRDVFRSGRRLFLLNPPAPPDTDTDQEERSNVAAILAALDDSGLEKIVAASTYGAQPGTGIGDLGVLFELEQALQQQPIPVTVNRGAYYMSNWAMGLDSAKAQGELPSFFPKDFELPMVSPDDLGTAAAQRLLEPVAATGLHHVEGPRRYTPADVAKAFAVALDRPVRVAVIPQEKWPETFAGYGFSPEAAKSYAGMTAASLAANSPDQDAVERGPTSLEAYIRQLVAHTPHKLYPRPPTPCQITRPFAARGCDERLASGLVATQATNSPCGTGAVEVVRRPAKARATGSALAVDLVTGEQLEAGPLPRC